MNAFDDHREAVVGYFIQDNQLLLLRTHYNENTEVWNGVSGYIDSGETPEIALQREAWEEIGVKINQLTLLGTDSITIKGNPTQFYFFGVTDWQGEPVSQEESIRQVRWFEKSNLPYNHMHNGEPERIRKFLSIPES